MNTAEIFKLIAQGLALLPDLLAAGVVIDQRIENLLALARGGAAGTISDADLLKIRNDFDADLDAFNTPME